MARKRHRGFESHALRSRDASFQRRQAETRADRVLESVGAVVRAEVRGDEGEGVTALVAPPGPGCRRCRPRPQPCGSSTAFDAKAPTTGVDAAGDGVDALGLDLSAIYGDEFRREQGSAGERRRRTRRTERAVIVGVDRRYLGPAPAVEKLTRAGSAEPGGSVSAREVRGGERRRRLPGRHPARSDGGGRPK